MPCQSDYLEQNTREKALQETAQLLIFAQKKLGIRKIDPALTEASNTYYCKVDYVPELCRTIRGMTKKQRDAIVYNGKDATSRKLADWWDRHKAADMARRAKEKTAKAAKRLT